MTLTLQIGTEVIYSSLIGLVTGLVIGWFAKAYSMGHDDIPLGKTIVTFIIICAWLYANIFLQIGDWWLNIMMFSAVGSVYGYNNIGNVVNIIRGKK